MRICQIDPTQAFANLLDALNERDIDTVVERAEALHGWIEKGGYLPTQQVGAGLTKTGWLVFLTGILGYWADPDKIKSRKEFASEMKKISENKDVGARHTTANDLMCDLLTEFGYGEGVVIFEEMEKWYE